MGTQSGKGIDWEKINSRLPVKKNNEEKALRKKMFSGFDPNGNGYLSLAELDKGIRDVLGLPQMFDAKAPIMRAYQLARKKGADKSEHSGDFVEWHEFRFFLVALRMYFEYWAAFARVDTSDDRRIDYKEFMQAVPVMEQWVGKISNP